MKQILLTSSVIFNADPVAMPSLGTGATFRDPALKKVILELHSNGIGDVVNLVPLIQEIASTRPDVAIHVATKQWRLPLQWCASNVSVSESSPSAAEREAQGTVYFNLTANAMYHVPAPHWLQFFFTSGIGTFTHHADPFPLMPSAVPGEMATRLGSGGSVYILLHLENTRREWEGRNTDPKNLLYIGQQLAGRGFRVFEIGNENPPSGIFPHLGKMTIEELIYAMKMSAGFVGIDSFPMHVAALYDKPLLGFFAATHPDVVLPFVTRLTMLRNEAIPCNGCVYITRPRDHNRCVLDSLACEAALPQAYLDERFQHFVASMEPTFREAPAESILEFWWRRAQLLHEETVMLNRLRGKRWIGREQRQQISSILSRDLG